MRDLKYLAALTLPVSAIIGINFMGFWSFLTPIYAFIIIPIMELILPQDDSNHNPGEIAKRSNNRLFDWLLYINIPIVFGVLLFALIRLEAHTPSLAEYIGAFISVGLVLGSNGINVAHELGHRQNMIERLMAKLLLLPSFYMHFYIEHNFGHHANAATPEDPATAKYNQTVYSFWLSSVLRQYYNAWKLQYKLLQADGHAFFSYRNDMLWYFVFEISYLMTISMVFGTEGLVFVVGAGVVGFLLLETVNYIEHYGLRRKKLASGRYERVKEIHSWNSNHIIGRIVLYELTRHSDHHYKSSKKYQLLDCHDISPQMPYGYPTSMVLSFLPPVWFHIMNKRIPEEMKPFRP
jgi:alkane 1-monooxygenase